MHYYNEFCDFYGMYCNLLGIWWCLYIYGQSGSWNQSDISFWIDFFKKKLILIGHSAWRASGGLPFTQHSKCRWSTSKFQTLFGGEIQ
jgi:hypothetical protein